MAKVPATVISVFACPSSAGDNPYEDKMLNDIWVLTTPGGYQVGQLYGVTNYVFCKGVTDAWCGGGGGNAWLPPGPPYVPVLERGMFDFQWAVPIRKITDGTSNTIAMGEGAHGPAWPVAKAKPGDLIYPTNTRTVAAGVDSKGQMRIAWQPWVGSEPSLAIISMVTGGGFQLANVMACTLEPLNKTPVTNAVADTSSLSLCAKSQPSAPGTPLSGVTTGGKHTTPNFRSDHSGGGNFLMADGSVHFLTEDINMLLYQQLSTMMGNEVVVVPD